MKKIILSVVLTFSLSNLAAQADFRVMFYNVENFFDTEDNPLKDDDEFLPEGSRRWTYGRYQNKRNNLAKAISSVGEWAYPALVGMCEVENEKVVADLAKNSPLKKADYRYVVTNSPDTRGINVALLYQRDKFKYLKHTAHRVVFPNKKKKFTRDILHVTGIVASRDTVDVFVCHFPSRRGGETESEPDRIYVASLLRSKCDSLWKIRRTANIIIMGDFNDEPSNVSISKTLKALPAVADAQPKSLYNLFSRFEKRQNTGSYKFQGQWNMLDQIIVSGNLIKGNARFRALPYSATIFTAAFLRKEDKTNGGFRPLKTYNGYRHEGGFSDHFPVYVDFEEIK
ncbi:MAG: endonuclease [Dysgonamonadaceae bacterium]|nr:endonuclease [Dysgonamonadaceae bacterium]